MTPPVKYERAISVVIIPTSISSLDHVRLMDTGVTLMLPTMTTLYEASDVDPLLASHGKLVEAVEKFLNDTSAIPPWESAGALWALRIKELHTAWLDSK